MATSSLKVAKPKRFFFFKLNDLQQAGRTKQIKWLLSLNRKNMKNVHEKFRRKDRRRKYLGDTKCVMREDQRILVKGEKED